MRKQEQEQNAQLLSYTIEKDKSIDTLWVNDEVWLTQKQMAELFRVSKSSIIKHLNNIFETNELNKNSTCQDFLQVAADGKAYNTRHYNLDVIISVGYRVNSKRGVKFRQWATQVLKDKINKNISLKYSDVNIISALKSQIDFLQAQLEALEEKDKHRVQVAKKYFLDLYDKTADIELRLSKAKINIGIEI